MEEAKKVRKLARYWLTRHVTTLQSALDTTTTTATELRALVEEYNKKVSRLEDAQGALELFISDEDLDAHVEEAEQYLSEKNRIKYAALEKLESLHEQSNDNISNHSGKSEASVAASAAAAAAVAGVETALAISRLPNLDLPRFNGDVFNWQEFFDAYMAHIGNNTKISEIDKFTHLIRLLDGDAKAAIRSFKLTAANYKPALDHLKERFGRPAFIRLKHINALLQLEAPMGKGSTYVKALWRMLDDIAAHTQALANLGCKGEHIEAILCPIIIGRFPKNFREEWARGSQGHESDLAFTLKFIKSEVERLERSEAFQSSVPSITHEKTREKPSSSATALHSAIDASSGICKFCKGLHKSYNCFKYKKAPLHVRRRKVRDNGLCYRCLETHFASSCTVKCSNCQEAHHKSLCSSNKTNGTKSQGWNPTAQNMGYVQTPEGMPAPGAGMAFGPPQGTLHGFTQPMGFSYGPQQGVFNGWTTQGSMVKSSSGTGSSSQPQAGSQDSFNYVSGFQQGNCGTGQGKSGSSLTAGNSLGSANLVRTATVLQTAKVRVKSPGGWILATLLYDSGCDRSYIASTLVKTCKPKETGKEWVSYSSFGGQHSSKPRLTSVYNLELQEVKGGSIFLSVAEVPVICPPLSRERVSQEILNHFQHLQLADDYGNNTTLHIEIVIGNDFYWHFLETSNIVQHEGLAALPSPFGYVLSGSWNSSHGYNKGVQLLCTQVPSDTDLSNFWNLDSIGIMPKESVQGTIDQHPALLNFNQTLQYSEALQRYQVALPYKPDCSREDLVNNCGIATKRLSSLHKKLDSDPKLHDEYYGVLLDYYHQGMVEFVPEDEISQQNGVFYMPHRPVIREGSSSSKIRPVFDCSAKGYNGKSLNDLLSTGPSLNPDLVAVMLRFRRWPIPLSGDVTKAFLQIYVRPIDKDAHRFLLKFNNAIHHMRFTRVPFGNTSSPFLLNAVVRFHLCTFPESELIKELREDVYVDNYLGGADSEEEAIQKFKEATAILASAGLQLSKWTTSNKSVSNHFGKSEVDNQTEMILGIKWMALSDVFYFEGLNPNLSFCSTKRSVLSVLSRLYDPMGIICPFILKAKILFQTIWRHGYDWDQQLPVELAEEFQNWLEDSKCLTDLKFSRAFFPNTPWSHIIGNVEIHAFGDASESGYGAVVYLRILLEGKYHISLCAARSRVAPIKKVSLPRLELLSALVCARLTEFVQTSLKLGNVKRFCYTDSQVTLFWIKGDALRFKTFIANRVSEIQGLVPPSCWQHCPGRYNPADIASRGLMASELKSSNTWFKGPAWLGMYDKIPNSDEVSPSLNDLQLTCFNACNISKLFNFDRFSNLNKVINYVSLVLRFIYNCRHKNQRCFGPLTSEERARGRLAIWRNVQREEYGLEVAKLEVGKPIPKESSLSKLNPFLCKQGLLRKGNRLDNADLNYDAKYPIIIPSGHIAKLLLRFQHVFMNHSGIGSVVTALKNKFWIIKAKVIAKTIIKYCVHCQRQDSRPCNEVAAPLPSDRVRKGPPFSVVGIDYAGPLYCSEFPKRKLYILLFVCGITRAIHLELTESLLTSEFLLCFRRFTARRGIPRKIYSDNARTFTSAANQLANHYGVHVPAWQFIVPRAPFWGGWWERLVRSVKSALRKSLGTHSLAKKELETVLCEVEQSINSRPLTPTSEHPGEPGPLTPAHFLMEQPLGIQIQDNLVRPLSAVELAEKYSARQLCLSRFWKIWKEQYITNLPPIVRSHKKGGTVVVGDIVLIRDEPLVSRLQWPLAKVVKVHPGADGKIRSVDVRTAKGIVCRPIQRLHRLEVGYSPEIGSDTSKPQEMVDDDTHQIDPISLEINNRIIEPESTHVKDLSSRDFNNARENDQEVTLTRSGRISRPPDRLCF